jgi:uncharacterized protein
VHRRTLLRAAALAPLAAAAAACASPLAGTRLVIASGLRGGVYFRLGTALAEAWRAELGLDALPVVDVTAGSVDNLRRLATAAADVGISQVDTAAEQVSAAAPGDPRALRALARIYDDVLHVVVPTSSTATGLYGLRGARVALGGAESGVIFTARRVLQAAGIPPDGGVVPFVLGLDESVAALRAGEIDAFFWSGGLPTQTVTELAAALPIRLLDLSDVLEAVRAAYPVYARGTVPAGAYAGVTEPVTTLLVRNVLLVTAAMPEEVAAALVRTLFTAQDDLARVSQALTIDPRAAIGTQPVPLHPGAQRVYREEGGG